MAHESHPPTCWGSEDTRKYRSGCKDHFKDAEANVRRISNLTLVPNPICTPECGTDPCVDPDPSQVAPAPRDSIPDDWYDNDCGGVGSVPRGRWPLTLLQDLYAANGPTLNKYGVSNPATYRNFATCRRIGVKRVYAYKEWHGVWGFRSPNRGEWWSVIDWGCGGCVAPSFHLTPQTTKYTAVNGTFTKETFDGSTTLTGTVSRGASVDRYSGKVTYTASGDGDGYAPWESEALTYVGFQTYLVVSLYNAFCIQANIYGTGGFLIVSHSQPAPDHVLTEMHLGDPDDPDVGGVRVNFEVDLTNGIYTHTWQTVPSFRTVTESVTLSDNGLVWDYLDAFDDGSYTHKRAEIHLSGAYSSDQLNADVNELLAKWNLCDDVQFPPFTSAYCRGGPLVTRNERINVGVSLQGDPDAEDTSLPPRAAQVDGGIIGAPLPNGSDAYFDFYAASWRYSGTQFDPITWGRYSPYPHATQWFAEDEGPWWMFPGSFLPNGPFQLFGRGSLNSPLNSEFPQALYNDALFKCMESQVFIGSRPGHNWQRPCGPDDVAEQDPASYDCEADPVESDARWPGTPCDCDGQWVKITDATNATPIVVTTELPHGRATGATVTICGVEGNTAANGTRKLVVTGPDTAELTDADDNPIAGNGDYELGGAMGKGAPPENFWNWSGKQGKFLWKTWSFDYRRFWESWKSILAWRDMTIANALGGSCQVPTPADPFNFQIIYGTVSGVPDMPDAIGDGSHMLAAQTTEQKCMRIQPCYPGNILVVPPDYPVMGCPENSVVIRMPNLLCDGGYHSIWVGKVDQWMIDPLWQVPGRTFTERYRCDDACQAWEQDGKDNVEICKQDYLDGLTWTCIRPLPPFEEAVDGVPGGAPALPDGAAQVGCANYVENLNADPQVIGPSECGPPYYVDELDFSVFGGCLPVWWIQLAQEYCVDNNVRGDFAVLYAENGAGGAAGRGTTEVEEVDP